MELASFLESEWIGEHARDDKHDVESKEQFKPRNSFDDGTTAQKFGCGLRGRNHNWYKKRQRQHRQQQLGEPGVGGDCAEQRSHSHQADRSKKSYCRERKRNAGEREIVKERHSGNRNYLHCDNEHEIRERFAKKNRLARNGRSKQSVDGSFFLFDSKRPMKSKQAGKREDHPQHSWSEIRSCHRGGIPGKKE